MIRVNVFAYRLILRVIILLTTCLFFGFIFLDNEWFFTQITLAAVVVLLTVELFFYLSKVNKDLSRLLDALKYDDYTASFIPEKLQKKYSPLYRKMEDIRQKQSERLDQGRNELNIWPKIVDQINTGIILLDEKEEILLQNASANDYVQSPVGSLEEIDSIIPKFKELIRNAGDRAQFNLDSIPGYTGNAIDCRVIKFVYETSPRVLLIFERPPSGSSQDYESWVNFGKVISHEILNGISPIVSLTNTLQEQLTNIEGNEKAKASMQKALNIIHNRSESLQQYSERYRMLNRLPEPVKEHLDWKSVLERSLSTCTEAFNDKGVEVLLHGPELNEHFKGDGWQMDQVFSNLALNSLHSFTHDATERKIDIHVSSNNLFFLIKFSDNGIGIDPNHRSKIFMPFFTTRESGSGIGLSVAKQILWKHGAEIFLDKSEVGTSFLIKYPKVI